MQINATNSSASFFSISDPRTRGALSFTSLNQDKPSFEMIESSLQRAEDVVARDRDPRQAAEQFVATALLTPLLAELREEPLSSDFLDGGFAEDAFRQQMDTILADRITSKGNFSIVDAVYRKMMDRTQGGVDTHG